MQSEIRYQRSSLELLFTAAVLLCAFGCAEKSATTVISVAAATATGEPAVVPVFASYIVCSAEFPDGQRYSHMLRMTAALDVVEFTGGLGQRVFATEATSVKLHSEQLLANFAAQEGVRAFSLSIHRASLDYGLTYNLEGADDKASVEGRCNVLEGDSFKLR